jgi:hypothetical protein
MKRQRRVRDGGKQTHNSYRGLSAVTLWVLMLLPVTQSRADFIYWTGSSAVNDNWTNGGNWAGGVPPSPTDEAIFNSVDSGNVNIVDTDFTIASLHYLGNGIHTTDFTGASNLQVNGPVYIGHGGSADGATVTWTGGGTAQIGTSSSLQTLHVALNNTSSGTNTSSFTVDRLEVEMHLNEMNVGYQSGGGTGAATGTLRWNSLTPIDVTNAYFARGPNATGVLEVPDEF